MDRFEGFYKETIDFLVGISFNNNKEWYYEHKNEYVQYCKEPITALANQLYEKLNAMDPEFTDRPKISRINRDIRFSKDKSPYKNAVWFFFRADGSPGIRHEDPTFFFEVMPEGYRFGLSYAPLTAADLLKMRNKMLANISEIQRYVEWFEKQKDYIIEGEKYKKKLADNVPESISDWFQRKDICFIKYCGFDEAFFKAELLDILFKEYKKFYKLYDYFKNI